MKKTLLKTMLLLCALIAGSGSVWAEPGDEVKSPTNVVSGKWYYIKGVYTSSSVEYTQYYTLTTDAKDTKMTDASATSIANAVPILFTQVTGGWTLTTPNGFYVRPHSSNGQSMLLEDEFIMTMTAGTTKEGANKGIRIGKFTDSSSNDWYIQANKASAKIGGYKATQWDVTLIEAYAPAVFATGKTMISYSDKNHALDLTTANLPAGLAAYKMTAADASSVTLSEVNSTVAKNTGVILTGTAATTYNIPVVGTGTDISGTNLLVASDGTSNVTSAYVLSDGKFHPVADAGIVIPAGKAYLPAGSISSARALDIVFDAETTGIKVVDNAPQFLDGTFFDLQGRKVAQPKKGLYIVNGKKVIIK